MNQKSLEMGKALKQLDKEWIELILTARNQGLTIEEIRAYLRRQDHSKEFFIYQNMIAMTNK